MSNNSIQNIVKKVNILIDENKFDEAKEEAEKIINLYNFNKYEMEYELLKRKINESSKIYDIKTSSLKDKYDEFIRMGKLNGYYDDNYIAYQYFMAGAYLTNLPYFYYKAGQAMYSLNEYEKAKELFEHYINSSMGYYKLSKAYYYLTLCKSVYNSKKRRDILEIKKTIDLSLININDGHLIKEYTHSLFGNIKNIINNIGSYSNLNKLVAIRILYLKNYKLLADKYLKKYYNDFIGDKEVKKELKKLELNRILYINKGKNKIK